MLAVAFDQHLALACWQAHTGAAQWRRSEDLLTKTPGCRQGTILPPVVAWQLFAL
jgi:hypothetical protein